MSPDSSRVVYRAQHSGAAFDEVYSVPVGGGAAIKLNDPAVPTDGIANGPLITPDSQRVIYNLRSNNSVFDIYSVPIGGGPSIKLNGTLVSGGRVFDYELYSVPATGGPVTKLNGALVSGGGVSNASRSQHFQISPDSSRVVYMADQDTDGVWELFSVPIGGGGTTKLNGPMVAAGDVDSLFGIIPDGSRVVYRADQDVNSKRELYSVPVTGGPDIKLNSTPTAGGDVSTCAISTDGERLIYFSDEQIDGVTELYSVGLGFGDYDAFEQFHGLTSPFDGDEEQDHNLNVFEYLGAGHPKEPDSPIRLQAARIDGADEFSFVLAPAVGNDIRIEIETSTDLTNTGPGAWAPIAVRENGVWTGFPVQITRLGDGLAQHTLLLVTSDHRFYRLRATLAR